MSIVRPSLFDWAFGQLKQPDIKTAIAAASLNKKLPYREFTPATMEKAIHSDRLYYGKGNSFANIVDNIGETIKFGRTFDATSESLAWGLSLILGGVATTGPTGNIYTHELTFMDPAVFKECLYTTIIEKAGTEYQKLISGVFFEDVTLTAQGRENIQIAIVASGRKQVTNATALPALTKSVVFRHNHATFSFGAAGAEVDISETVQKWNVKFSQNPDVRWVPGQSSGEEKLLRYALTGNQTVSGSITFFLDNTLRNHFLNHDRVALTIYCKGVYHIGHELKIEIPAFYVNQEAIGEGGMTTEYTLSFNEDVVVLDASVPKSPVTVTLKNEIAALLG